MSVEIIEINSAAKTAWKNEAIPKFGITCASPNNTAPLIMGIINPSDTIANGRVNIRIIGLTNMFINVSKTVVINKASIVLNENPSKRALVIQREIPVARRLVKFATTFEDIAKI